MLKMASGLVCITSELMDRITGCGSTIGPWLYLIGDPVRIYGSALIYSRRLLYRKDSNLLELTLGLDIVKLLKTLINPKIS